MRPIGGHDMSLSDDTLDVTTPAPRATLANGPCWWCRVGAHDMCTGVACYRCPPENHPRAPGIAGAGEGVGHGAPGPGGKR